MKVLSYLELQKLKEYENNRYLEQISILKIDLFKGDDLDFYSQPFRPELMTELFEPFGFTFSNLEYDVCASMPRTLDDFINDCQRAGIQLEWRQQ